MELAHDLVRRGAELEAPDNDGFTALMYAANGDQNQVVQLLIKAGADVNGIAYSAISCWVSLVARGRQCLIVVRDCLDR